MRRLEGVSVLKLKQVRRALSVVAAIALLAGSTVPASATDPTAGSSVTVAGTRFHAAGLPAGGTSATPKRVLKARAASTRQAAVDHAATVRGVVASGTVVDQMSTPSGPQPGHPETAIPGAQSITSASEAASDLAPGLSVTQVSRYPGGETMAASPTFVMQASGSWLGAYPRDDPPDEATWTWEVEAFLGLPAAEAGYGPAVAWDQRHGRWVVAAGSWEYNEASCNEGFIVLAVSTGENPAGTWTRWRIPVGANSVDSISLGLSDTLIALGGNEFPLDSDWVACLGLPFSGARLRVLDWADVIDGGGITVRDLTPSQPRRSWSYRLARNVAVDDAPDAGADIALLVDRYDPTRGSWGNVVHGSITGSAVAGTTALATTDLTATGTVPALGGPPWLGASPGYRLNGDWLGEGGGIDEAFQSIARRGTQLLASAAASCTPDGDASVRTCLRVITLDLGGANPTSSDDALLASAGVDTYFGAVGFAHDGTTFAMVNRGSGTVATWRPAGQPISTPEPAVHVAGGDMNSAASWPSQASLVADPVDTRLAWSTLPTPEFGVYSPVIALRGGVAAAPSGSFTLPAWSHASVPLRLAPSPDSPITQVRVSGSPNTYTWNGHEYLASVTSGGVSSTRLRAGLEYGDGPRTVYVQWLTADNVPSPIVSAQTMVDDTAPTLSGTRAYVVPQTLGSSLNVRWTLGGSDGAGIGIGGWQVWSRSEESESVLRELTPASPSFTLATRLNLQYQVDAQGRDKLGNVNYDNVYLWAKSRLVQNTSSGVKYGGSWATRSARSASGGSVKVITSKGTATIRTTGVAFGIVATKGPGRGRFSVSIDGGPAKTIDTYRSSIAYRQVVWQTSTWNGPHTIKITTLATGGRPRIDLDAFLVMEDGWSG